MVVKSMFTYLVVKRCYSPRRLLAVSHQILNTLNNRNTVINTKYKSVLAINQLKSEDMSCTSIQASFTNYNIIIDDADRVKTNLVLTFAPQDTIERLTFIIFYRLAKVPRWKNIQFFVHWTQFHFYQQRFLCRLVGLPMRQRERHRYTQKDRCIRRLM